MLASGMRHAIVSSMPAGLDATPIDEVISRLRAGASKTPPPDLRVLTTLNTILSMLSDHPGDVSSATPSWALAMSCGSMVIPKREALSNLGLQR